MTFTSGNCQSRVLFYAKCEPRLAKNSSFAAQWIQNSSCLHLLNKVLQQAEWLLNPGLTQQ